jgi:hypothetical protein
LSRGTCREAGCPRNKRHFRICNDCKGMQEGRCGIERFRPGRRCTDPLSMIPEAEATWRTGRLQEFSGTPHSCSRSMAATGGAATTKSRIFSTA